MKNKRVFIFKCNTRFDNITEQFTCTLRSLTERASDEDVYFLAPINSNIVNILPRPYRQLLYNVVCPQLKFTRLGNISLKSGEHYSKHDSFPNTGCECKTSVILSEEKTIYLYLI